MELAIAIARRLATRPLRPKEGTCGSLPRSRLPHVARRSRQCLRTVAYSPTPSLTLTILILPSLARKRRVRSGRSNNKTAHSSNNNNNNSSNKNSSSSSTLRMILTRTTIIPMRTSSTCRRQTTWPTTCTKLKLAAVIRILPSQLPSQGQDQGQGLLLTPQPTIHPTEEIEYQTKAGWDFPARTRIPPFRRLTHTPPVWRLGRWGLG